MRATAGGLYFSAVLGVLGFVTNRLNVSITGMEASAGAHYIPKWTEIAVTASIIATDLAVFALAVKHPAIFPGRQPRGEFPRPAGREITPVRT